MEIFKKRTKEAGISWSAFVKSFRFDLNPQKRKHELFYEILKVQKQRIWL